MRKQKCLRNCTDAKLFNPVWFLKLIHVPNYWILANTKVQSNIHLLYLKRVWHEFLFCLLCKKNPCARELSGTFKGIFSFVALLNVDVYWLGMKPDQTSEFKWLTVLFLLLTHQWRQAATQGDSNNQDQEPSGAVYALGKQIFNLNEIFLVKQR